MSIRRSGSATIAEAATSAAAERLAVARVRRFRQAVLRRVLDLDLGEVGLGVAVHFHAAARVQRKVGRVGDAEAEAHPIRIIRTRRRAAA